MRFFSKLFFLGVCLLGTITMFSQVATIKVPNCNSDLYKFKFNGIEFVKGEALTKTEDFTYTLSNDTKVKSIVYIGAAQGNPVPVVLDGKESFAVTGNCLNLNQAIFVGSKSNDKYKELKKFVGELQKTNANVSRTFNSLPKDSPAQKEAQETMNKNDLKMIAKMDELKKDDPFSADIVALNLYRSYPNREKTDYDNELNYFANERFQYVDFSSKSLVGNPWVYETFRSYAVTLAKSGITNGQAKTLIGNQLEAANKNASVHKLALGGVIAALSQIQAPYTDHFAQLYIDQHGNEEPKAKAKLTSIIQRANAFKDGAVAPDFKQMTIDSTGSKGPSDFKGKVLLIDFWASWCGPCRRENPNVVKLYNRFKDKGFDILGVSLDKQYNRWKKAVEADQLAWTHVSDLKGWRSAAAALYGVRSIPATVLLDREGKIVARNLRGAALEAKVEELMKE